MEHERSPEGQGETREHIHARVAELIRAALRELGAHAFVDEIATKSRKILQAHPNAKDNLWYHFMVGSTGTDATITQDFPGEESIEEFLKALPLEGAKKRMAARCEELRLAAFEHTGVIETAEMVERRAEELKQKYSDWERRIWYYGLVDGTPPDHITEWITEDFPGEDSVETFFESLGPSTDEEVAS